MAKKKKEEGITLATSENILLGNNDSEKIKKDLEKYIDQRIDKVFIEELDKSNRKLLREKNKKLFIKNIIIIILLLIIGFLIYLLYSNNYFDHFFNKDNKEIQEKTDVKEDIKEEEKEKEEEKKEVKKPTLAELKKEYANLLDNYVMNDKCTYLEDFYSGNLTNNIRLYFTLDSLNFDSLKKEDDYQIILDDTFKIAYEQLFNNDYTSSSFNYNGNMIRYVSMMNSYMTTSLLEREKNLIEREISDIQVDGDKVIITTIEGLVKDHKLYNVLDNREIDDYNEDSLLNYGDDLNHVMYVFKDNKLVDLVK